MRKFRVSGEISVTDDDGEITVEDGNLIITPIEVIPEPEPEPTKTYLNYITSPFVEIPSSNSLHLTNGQFTLEARIYARTFGQNKQGRIIDKGGASGINSGWTFRIETSSYNNSLCFVINHKGYYSDTTVINLNQWHHVAVTRSDGILTFYIDGITKGIRTRVELPKSNNVPVRIGMRATDLFRGFDGYIDDIRIWNLGRTQEQINTYKDVELTGHETGLIAYYPCNEGSGTTIADLSGNQAVGQFGTNNKPIWVVD